MMAGQRTENKHWHKIDFQKVFFCVLERKISYSGSEQYESEYIIFTQDKIIHFKCVGLVSMQWHYQVERNWFQTQMFSHLLLAEEYIAPPTNSYDWFKDCCYAKLVRMLK